MLYVRSVDRDTSVRRVYFVTFFGRSFPWLPSVSTHLLQSRQDVVRVGLRYRAHGSHLAVLLEAASQGLSWCGHSEDGQEQLPTSQVAVCVRI